MNESDMTKTFCTQVATWPSRANARLLLEGMKEPTIHQMQPPTPCPLTHVCRPARVSIPRHEKR